jgi:hypothetical protein
MAHIDLADKDPSIPEYDPNLQCPDHPKDESEMGYGLAGGGMGPYTVCATCSRILSKTVDPDPYD